MFKPYLYTLLALGALLLSGCSVEEDSDSSSTTTTIPAKAEMYQDHNPANCGTSSFSGSSATDTITGYETCSSWGVTSVDCTNINSGDGYDNSCYVYYAEQTIVETTVDDSGDSVNCDTVWIGDPADVQVSSECQTACVYLNAGVTDGVNAACDIVAGWNATADCTVCQ